MCLIYYLSCLLSFSFQWLYFSSPEIPLCSFSNLLGHLGQYFLPCFIVSPLISLHILNTIIYILCVNSGILDSQRNDFLLLAPIAHSDLFACVFCIFPMSSYLMSSFGMRTCSSREDFHSFRQVPWDTTSLRPLKLLF